MFIKEISRIPNLRSVFHVLRPIISNSFMQVYNGSLHFMHFSL